MKRTEDFEETTPKYLISQYKIFKKINQLDGKNTSTTGDSEFIEGNVEDVL